MTIDPAATVAPPLPSLDDPSYRAGVLEMLGLLGCGHYLAFERLVSESALSPSLGKRLSIARVAEDELVAYDKLAARLSALGADPTEMMGRFLAPLERYHQMTTPGDWLESVVKSYVGDAIASDFYMALTPALDPETADLVREVCAESEHRTAMVAEIHAAIAADPRVAGRLALWGRRLLGEALSRIQTLAAASDELARILLEGGPGLTIDLVDLIDGLTTAHAARMTALGLAA